MLFYRFKSRQRMRILLIILGSLSLGAFFIQAADRYVSPPGGYGTNNPPYTSWADAATNIQWAVNAAAAGETVWVTNGYYCITNQVTITNRITLRSMNGYSNTSVYADWPAYTTRCFYVSLTSVVDGFTISNGHFYGSNDYSGGGGACLGTRGLVKNCYFVNNVCSNRGQRTGGGGVNADGNSIVSNCVFVSNMSYTASGGAPSSGSGGAIRVYDGWVLNCIIISNYAQGYYGGGIYCYTASGAALYSFISGCVISCNSGPQGGGGIYIASSEVTDCIISNNTSTIYSGGALMDGHRLKNSLIVNNYAPAGGGITVRGYLVSNCVVAANRCASGGSGAFGGGGILLQAGTVDGCRISNNLCTGAVGGGGVAITNTGFMRNSLVCNNTNTASAGRGGGVLMGNATLGLLNCTIVNNYSTNEGGGIATVTPNNSITNCIIAGNRSSSNNYPDVYNTDSNSNNFWYCCANPTSAPLALNQGNITNDPMFVDSSGNWRLKPSSPCVNAGINQDWMTNSLDLDGRMRIRYGTVDIGAYETIYDGTILKF